MFEGSTRGGVLVALGCLSACGRLAFDDAPGLLVVDSIEDHLLPGERTLRGALETARAESGPHRIVFDPDVFPATIVQTGTLTVPAHTTIDAFGAGVTLAASDVVTGALLEVTGDDVVVDGLLFTRNGTSTATAITSMATTNLRIDRVKIRDIGGEAIHLEGCISPAVRDVYVENPTGDAIALVDSTDAAVERASVVLGVKSGAIHGILLQGTTQSRVTDSLVDPGEAWMIGLVNASDNLIAGNIADRGDSGLVLEGACARNTLVRNVVIAPLYDSVYLGPECTDNQVLHNTFFMAGDVVINAALGTMAANNLVSTTASDFVDPATYDFHLAPGSPSVDAATDLGLDMLPDDPGARFLGASPDLGAVETR